jgi:hypothetical protein
MELKYKEAKLLTRFDLGWTEDEYNNLIVDTLYESGKEKDADNDIADTQVVPCTIIITPEDIN